jgi:hypothetical protein
MPIKKLTDVPDHIWGMPETSGQSSGAWQSDYNIAAWIRYDERIRGPVRLFLMWQDTRGDHHLCVDQSDISSNSVLLSGIARIKAHGPLKSLSIGLESLMSNYVVDELFVQPAHYATMNQKLIV